MPPSLTHKYAHAHTHTHTHLQEYSTVCINIGPGVLCLSLLCQYAWGNLKQLRDELKEGVVWEVFLCKLSLAHVSWVSLTQHCMAIARDHLQQCSRIEIINTKIVTLAMWRVPVHC